MDSIWNDHYGVVKRMSSIVGQWPYQRPRVRLIGIVLITLNTSTIIIPQVAKLVKCSRDFQCIFATTPPSLLSVGTLVKLYGCHFNSSKIRDLADRIFVDWQKLRTRREYEILKRYADNGRRVSIGYIVYSFVTLFLFLSAALVPYLLDVVLPLNESRPIVQSYPAYYFVDDEREYFYYIFLHSVVTWNVALLGLLVHDCIILTLVEHGCSVFAIVGYRLERLMKRSEDSAASTRRSRDVYRERVVSSVHAHQRALKFSQMLEDTFSFSFGIQIVILTMVITITMVQIALQINDILETTRFVMFVIAELIHLFCISLEGQRLMDHGLRTYETICNNSWYEIPVNSQKMLLLVIKKSMRPIYLSAVRLYVFSLENFTMVLQTSMSYFTVLVSLQ